MPFPTNVVDALAEELTSVQGLTTVMRRPLRPTDPNGAAGVYANDWMPNAMVIGQYDPAVGTYLFQVQAFIKHTDEELGREQHTNLAKEVRDLLYRNPDLRLRLGTLSDTDSGVTERVQRWGVRQQRYAANEIDGQFLYLSTTEFWVETETV